MAEKVKSFVALLGAGASVDAGLLTSARLTEAVYRDISSSRSNANYARVLAYVIAKLQTRNAKLGLSPYHPIEVEELFDAVNLLYRRDRMLIAEFVERWDQSIDDTLERFDSAAIKSALSNVIGKYLSASAQRSRPSFFDSELENFAKAMHPRGLYAPGNRLSSPQRQFISSLVGLLEVDAANVAYLEPLVDSDRLSLVATLNYDLSVEKACIRLGKKYDYGLSKWNRLKRVDWESGSTVRLLKMHGSVNWTGSPENPIIKDDISQFEQRLMIFGGVDNKLSPTGPFLQFLYRFERALLQSERLVVIGYSFRDQHINAIIQRWRLTRRSAKMTIIDPSPPQLAGMGFVPISMIQPPGQKSVNYSPANIIREGAGQGIRTFLNFGDSPFEAHA